MQPKLMLTFNPDWAPGPKMSVECTSSAALQRYAAHTGWLRRPESSALDVLGSQLSPGPVSDDIHAP